MKQTFSYENRSDGNGNPTGGYVDGTGLRIDWQNGPLGRDGDRIDPNGCFVETVLEAAKIRLEYYQSSKFACIENQQAILYLNDALNMLDCRTQNREKRGVEGTHEV